MSLGEWSAVGIYLFFLYCTFPRNQTGRELGAYLTGFMMAAFGFMMLAAFDGLL